MSTGGIGLARSRARVGLARYVHYPHALFAETTCQRQW
jgi:hypothetical protein